MIVCNTMKELTNATNVSDAAGAVAVKEYVAEHAGGDLTPSTTVTVSGETTTLESYIADVAAENLELTTTTPVDVSGTETTLADYVEDVAGNIVKSVTLTGTTTSSGAISLTGLTNKKILEIKRNDAVGFCFNRGDTYGTCFDTNMTAVANAEVSITVYYLD